MKKSYIQIIKQIEALKQEAEKMRRNEVEGVVTRIREAMSHYSLTAADLGLDIKPTATAAPTTATATRKTAVKASRKSGKAAKAGKPAAVAKFRDEAGNSWVGRGKRPQWLRDALIAGKTLKDFAV
jgi:DNA-binding protein H-NS